MRWSRWGIWAGPLLVLASVAAPVWPQQPTMPQQIKQLPIPAGLPKYDLDIVLDVQTRQVKVREVVTWTNQTNIPAREIVFNAHARYAIPNSIKDHFFLAKTVELLRMSPKEGLSFDGPALEVDAVRRTAAAPLATRPTPRSISLMPRTTQRRLHIPLPAEVAPGHR